MTSNGLAETSNHIQYNPTTYAKGKCAYVFQCQRNGFQSGRAKEQWKVMPATMVAQQEKIVNFKMAKHFNPGGSLLTISDLKSFLLFPLFPFFLFANEKKWRKEDHGPPALRYCQSCFSHISCYIIFLERALSLAIT